MRERGERPFTGQRGSDDDQENRERATQGAGGVGDAEQKRVPQALFSLHRHLATQDAERLVRRQDPYAQPHHGHAEDDSDVGEGRDQPLAASRDDEPGGKEDDDKADCIQVAIGCNAREGIDSRLFFCYTEHRSDKQERLVICRSRTH